MILLINAAFLLTTHLVMTTALNIVDWRNQTTYWDARTGGIYALVLHHTVTPTAQGTLDVLNTRRLSIHYIADKNGTIYQTVDEANRAWHTGTGVWGNFVDMNDVSVGIEIVNSGDEPFPEVQEMAVAALSKAIVGRYGILPKNIVSHADFDPRNKEDVSGYF
uniref:N-acetylmuramoyl-L-alanine amidase n=2 Tax=Plectus sambesii TaxID=2011161 RepID=A0A914UV77_9BILA